LIAGFYAAAKLPKGDEVLWINAQHSLFLDTFFYYATSIGNGIFYVVIIIVLLWYNISYGLLAGICFASTGLVIQFLKRFIFPDMVRPKLFLQDHNIHFVEGVEVLSHHSFPSGHSATAFSMFLLLALLHKKPIYGMFFCLIAIIVGVSRIYLLQHFLLDVLVGSVIGLVVTYFIYSVWYKAEMFNKPLLQKPLKDVFRR
jgi:membrane-associated phospholipid phosphatase